MSETSPSASPPRWWQLQGWGVPILVTTAFVLVLWYFIGTPLEQPGNLLGSITLVALILSGIFLVATGRYARNPHRLLIILVIGAALIIPVYSATRACYYFGQPLFYGLLSERHWFGLALGPIVYHLVTIGKLHTAKLVSCLVVLAWLSLFWSVGTVCTYVLGGDDIKDLFELTAVSSSDHRGLRVNLPIYPIIFGALYYLARASRGDTLANLLKSGLFTFYVFFIARGRLDMACLSLAMCYGISTSGLLSRWRMLATVGTIYIVLGSLIPQYSPGADESAERGFWSANIIVRTYRDIFSLLEGEAAIDQGLNARRMSLSQVTDRLLESPSTLLMGVGRVSNRWRGGFSGVLDTWFYPQELGILGAIFVYGLILYSALAVLSLYLGVYVLRWTSGAADFGLTALRWVLLFWIAKFVSGVPLLSPTQFFLTIFLCLAIRRGFNKQAS
jgi:hypothetical protein